MKSFIFFNTLLLLSQYVYPQTDSTILFIKDGSAIHIVVSKIYDRALLDSQNHGVSYKVIDSLWTADSSLANRFDKLHCGIKFRKDNQGLLLDFTEMRLPDIRPDTSTILQLRTHSYIYYPSTSHRIGVQLDYILFSLNRLIFRTEGTLGLQSNQSPFSDINFNVGLGYNLDSDWLKFKAVIGYGIYARTKGIKGENRTGSTIFISPTLQVPLIKEYHCHILFGLNLSIYRSLLGVPEDPASFYTGFGFQLK